MPKGDPFIAYFDCGGEYGYDFDIREYIPKGSAIIDRARFERLLACVELAHEWMNAPEDSSIGRRAEDALTYAVDDLQPGDLDPLP